jgi:hypothetical protein
MIDRRSFLFLAAAAAVRPARVLARRQSPGHHVYPTGSIQEALEAAAGDKTIKTVYVHAGTYRPSARVPEGDAALGEPIRELEVVKRGATSEGGDLRRATDVEP